MMRALREYEAAAGAMADAAADDAIAARFERATEQMEALGAWTAQSQAQRVLATLLPKYANAPDTKVRHPPPFSSSSSSSSSSSGTGCVLRAGESGGREREREECCRWTG